MAEDTVQKSSDAPGRLPSARLRLDIRKGTRLRLVPAFTNIVWGG